jgi:hypothetical protein
MAERVSRIARLSYEKFVAALRSLPTPQLQEVVDYIDENRYDEDDMDISDEQYEVLWDVLDERSKPLQYFCESSDPLYLLYLDPVESYIMLRLAPIAMSMHSPRSKFYDRAKNAVDILESAAPLVPAIGGCKFKPLDWVGSSCYVDSVLFALLAMPNSFVSETILDAVLAENPRVSHKYPCAPHLKIGQVANAQVDLDNRRRVRDELLAISKSLKGGVYVETCQTLRDILISCPHPEKYDSPGDKDAGEYLAFLMSMFPDTQQVVLETKKLRDGELISSNVEYSNLVWDVPVDQILYEPPDRLLTTRDLLEVTYDNYRSGYEYTDVSTVVSAPYLVIHLMRCDGDGDCETEEDGFSSIPVLPLEHLTLESGKRLTLSALVYWENAHYTCSIRCENLWYYYNDAIEDKIGGGLTYRDMLISDETPLVMTSATMYFYV